MDESQAVPPNFWTKAWGGGVLFVAHFGFDDEPSASSKETQAKEPKSGFDYLLGMPIWSLTWERVEDLRKQLKEKTAELTDLQNSTPEALWEKDLDVVVAELDRMDEEEDEMKKEEGRLRSGKRTKSRAKPKAKGAKEDEPMEPDEDDEEPTPVKKPKGEETSAELLARLKERQKHRASLLGS
ncbi:DNA topoisomerase 2 (DNA topoisomerase II) [Durusdinium trenchii]|uniref:DNA topoisomerase (ATP-hydrolyzing) n=1 Tax=Durusdinium trenchii TaxID=1381693 RepID=A0ABP0LDT0_9DINO